MKIICFATLKGGSGKTTNAFNIAGILAEKKKVLLLDIDPQANLTSNMNIDIESDSIPSVKDIFEDPKKQLPPDAIVQKGKVEALPNLDILPSSINLFEIEELVNARLDKPKILAKYIAKYNDFFSKYDYIIIDTNPSMSVFNINGFYVANSIVLNSDIGWNSLKGAKIFRKLWDAKREQLEIGDNITALIISNYSGVSNVSKAFLNSSLTDSKLADLTCENYISRTDKLKEAEVYHIPVSLMKKDRAVKKAIQQYEAVIKELKKVEVL